MHGATEHRRHRPSGATVLRELFPPDLLDHLLLVGGTVRDILGGRESEDLDIVAFLEPSELVCRGFRLVEAKSAAPVYFRSHPVAGKIEATLLADRRDLPHDLRRRDFTINAMAMEPDGTLVDPLCGERDLKAGLLRACAPDAFETDPIRIFRGLRFEAEGWRLTPDSEALIRAGNWANVLATVPVERFGGELRKALAKPDPARFFRRMAELGVTDPFLPELSRMADIPAGPPEKHPEGDLLTHSLQVLERIVPLTDDPLTRFCALFHDLGKLATPAHHMPGHPGHDRAGGETAGPFCDRLRLPVPYRTGLRAICSLHQQANRWDSLDAGGRMALAAAAVRSGVEDMLPLVSLADKPRSGSFAGWEEALEIVRMTGAELGIDSRQMEAVPPPERSALLMQRRIAAYARQRGEA